MSQIERGIRQGSIETIRRIAKALGVPASLLLDEPQNPTSREEAEKMFAWFSAHSDDVPINMISMCIDYPDLVPPHWNVEKAINAAQKNKTDHLRVAQQRPDYDLAQIPIISHEQTACCGSGTMALDITSEPEEIVSVPRSMLGMTDPCRPPFAQRTNGSSMASHGIAPESIVVINPAEEVTSGNIALVCMGDKQTVKKIIFRPQTIELLSDGQTITIDKEDFEAGWFRILGKIVAIFSQPNHSL